MLTGTKNMFRNSVPDNTALHSPARRKLLRGLALTLALLTTKFRTALAADPQQHVQQTLEKLAYHLFPHAGLPAGPYQEVANALAALASTDAKLAQELKLGIAELDAGSKTRWLERSEEQQLIAVQQIEGSPFFHLMRRATIEHLYRNKKVWKLIGYEGSSVEFGGYLDRGFDDIDWLPGEGNQR